MRLYTLLWYVVQWIPSEYFTKMLQSLFECTGSITELLFAITKWFSLKLHLSIYVLEILLFNTTFENRYFFATEFWLKYKVVSNNENINLIDILQLVSKNFVANHYDTQ